MFMNWMTQYHKDMNCIPIIYKFDAMPVNQRHKKWTEKTSHRLGEDIYED